VCFIGVTGSCGKTTTKELIGAILADRSHGLTSNQLYNGPEHVALSMFRVRPWHHFCVHEVGASRGSEVSSAWPDRLSLSVTHEGERVYVRTRLLGEHWASCILAALATGISVGVPLAAAARVIQTVEPVEGRMSPHLTAEGVAFIDDGWKAPLWTISVTLRFLQMARARRKVMIIGTISDYSASASRTYADVAGKALAVADRVIFVGPLAHCALKARHLVLLKGSRHTDHLERLVLAATNDIACWRLRCGRGRHCMQCELRTQPVLPSPRTSQEN
jgi:UDP-N-acetylmuramyl pentapeptide synthase